MEPWKTFWTLALLVAGAGFTFITLMVMIKGTRDMRDMLSALKAHHNDEKTH